MNEEQLQLYLQQIVMDIYLAIEEKDLSKQAQQDELIKQIGIIMQRFDIAIDDLIPPMIVQSYFGSAAEAATLLTEAGAVAATTGLSAAAASTAAASVGAGGVIAAQFKSPLHIDSVESLLVDAFDDLAAARRSAEENLVGNLVKTITSVKEDMVKGKIAGEPRKVIQQKVMKSFLDGGLVSFTTKEDKNGRTRQLPLDFYAITVTRTKTREAAIEGAINRYEESGEDLVMIEERADTCEVCARFRGMIVSLKGKTPGFPVVGENGILLPPYHPNCRGTIRVYVLRYKTEDELAEARNRNASYKRDVDTRTPAQKKAYDKEQKMRAKANAEKKQFMRWTSVMEAEAPKTLGAFRRMKRANSPKFQELQSHYLSLTHTKR